MERGSAGPPLVVNAHGHTERLSPTAFRAWTGCLVDSRREPPEDADHQPCNLPGGMPAASPLTRLFAHAVIPRASELPTGGAVHVTRDVYQALGESYDKAKLDRALPVSFVIDTSNRSCEMRDLILAVAFGDSRRAKSAASRIATRLASVMDARSKDCLLVISVGGPRDTDERQVVIWTFPRDEAFKLSSTAEAIELLNDVFSRSSHLRKAAVFAGRNLRTDFLSGRVLDFQANTTDRYIADFWIEDFLGAQLQISSDEGTRILATTLRTANKKLEGDVEAQEQLLAAIAAVRHAPQRRLSLQTVADTYLQGRAREAFVNSAPNREALTGIFDFDRGRFEQLLQFRVFHLDTGVTVTAPFGEVGQSVTIDEQNDGRYLRAHGVVADEKVTARHG